MSPRTYKTIALIAITATALALGVFLWGIADTVAKINALPMSGFR